MDAKWSTMDARSRSRSPSPTWLQPKLVSSAARASASSRSRLARAEATQRRAFRMICDMPRADVKLVVTIVVLGGLAWLLGAIVHLLVRLRFPARIPSELGFEREVRSGLALREIAEKLAKMFPGPIEGVVCLGVVRGNAARVLFHSGPTNRGKNRSLHRPDYILEAVRRGKSVVLMRLTTNRPYSYLRIRRSELDPLVSVLRKIYGEIVEVE